MIDCQMRTEHLASLGAREIPRRAFLDRLQTLTCGEQPRAAWRLDPPGSNW
jgi:leucyl/phenylalanyl-tRNA--protein transferase